MTKIESKLIIVTRNDLHPSYQLVQSDHSVCDFAFEYWETFKKWKVESNSIISLQIKNESSLLELFDEIKNKGIDVVKFYEPDIDQYTSICFWASPENRKITSKLKLSLK